MACPMSEEQHQLQEELVKRYERLRSEKVDPREDNALAITTDGRKLATDARMVSETAPDFPESKINRLVENVAATWSFQTPSFSAFGYPGSPDSPQHQGVYKAAGPIEEIVGV